LFLCEHRIIYIDSKLMVHIGPVTAIKLQVGACGTKLTPKPGTPCHQQSERRPRWSFVSVFFTFFLRHSYASAMEVCKCSVWSKKDQQDFEVCDLEACNKGLDKELESRDRRDESNDNKDSNTGGSQVAENKEDVDEDGDGDVDVGSNGPDARSNGFCSC
jgi:hypothetical protein